MKILDLKAVGNPHGGAGTRECCHWNHHDVLGAGIADTSCVITGPASFPTGGEIS